ncbi:hypothetical protein [Streptomyces sp. MST-110588]|uniref:hypothetical protein n=1 Tax=Streptomyces sp. MST-110588 TaxID=2833628 RepID=UPI001F5DBB3A|nr:hypothetical protein [Streptomyces sp. MST-110588]UNO41956.1 hypothetical protein KGS77_23460 [Streptomyces sp. MST-110588]
MARRTGITKTVSNIVDDIKDMLDDALDSVCDLEHDTRDSLSRSLRPERERDTERDTERRRTGPDEARSPQLEMAALWSKLGQIEELLRQQQEGTVAAQPAGRAKQPSS